jgi:hypothetical protein
MASEHRPDATRRTVVRTAATAAWAAPVIVAASAAPAYAGSPTAAVLRAPDPTFLRLGDAITIISQYDNFGTGAAASMMVSVTITPTSGTLVDADPTGVRSGFSFVDRTTSPSGGQVLNFIKNAPQIPPGDQTLDRRLQFTISHAPDSVSGVRAGQVAIAPVVPPPSTAAASQGTYTSTEEPDQPPVISVLGVDGVRQPASGGTVNCEMTFFNDGGAATALSVDVDFVVAVPGTSLAYGVGSVSAPWTASPHTVTPGGQLVTFTRTGGMPPNAAGETLTFTINSAMGTGNIVVSSPETTPTGVNAGNSGTWGDA